MRKLDPVNSHREFAPRESRVVKKRITKSGRDGDGRRATTVFTVEHTLSRFTTIVNRPTIRRKGRQSDERKPPNAETFFADFPAEKARTVPFYPVNIQIAHCNWEKKYLVTNFQ